MIHAPTKTTARISEIFSSLQGEGTHVGEKHIFIRFEECHMHCEYCDELGKPAEDMLIEDVLSTIEKLEQENGPHQFISLTGGEPLLYLEFIKPLIQKLKAKGFQIYLETSGVLYKALSDVVLDCDCVAMDMKATSVTKERNYDAEHKVFLEIATKREVFVKMVISEDLSLDEFDAHVAIIENQDNSIPLILMPISLPDAHGQRTIEGHQNEQLMTFMGQLQSRAAQRLKDVRIVPRMHKILNIP